MNCQPAPPQFLYFDLGKVLVDFSLERMLEQVGAVAGVSAERAHEILYADGLMQRHETGRLDSRGLYEAFCTAAGSRPDYDALLRATNEIFTLNLPVLPLVAELGQTGYPLGILSNTCETHWDYCHARFRIVAEGFSVYALSHRIGAEAGRGHFPRCRRVGRLQARADFLRRRPPRAYRRRAGSGVRRRAVHHRRGPGPRVAPPGNPVQFLIRHR